MSVNVIKTESASGMTARDRLRSMLEDRMREKVIASQATETNVPKQTSDKEAEPPAKKRKLSTCKLKCSIVSCDKSFSRMRQVIEHLNEIHHHNLEAQHLTFSTEAEFDEWKLNVERSALCYFLRGNVQKKWSSAVHSYYYCSRSCSSRRIPKQRKRHLKVQGYSKINRTCPAYIVKHVTQDGISVDYYAKHLCYTDTYEQLGHVRLSAADRAWLAEKLALQIPMDAILRDVRNTLDGQLTRLHLVTKQDLTNIAQAFHLKKPERQHEDDATSSDGKDDSPVLTYKQQGAGHFDILTEGVDNAIVSPTNLVYDKQFDRLTTICKGKYTRKLYILRKRHAASITMQFISCETVPGKEWCVHSECEESQETDYYTVRLDNTECVCSMKCSDCAACIHRYSCTCRDNQKNFNMCHHIHYVGMLKVRMKPEKTKATVLLENSADSDSTDCTPFQIDSTDEIHPRQECEAAALVQQLSCPVRKLEERRKQLEERLQETSLFIQSLTTLEEMDVVETTLCDIKRLVTAVRAKRATMTSTSLVPTADRCEEPSNENVEKQRRFFTTKRRVPAASSSALAKPSNKQRRKS